MASIYDFFGYRAEDLSDNARDAAQTEMCPFLNEKCEKTVNDRTISGVCSVKPVNAGAVICCPIRLYAEDYKILRDVSDLAFESGLELVPGREAYSSAKSKGQPCVAVFGKRWGGELYVPQKQGAGKYFVDWILARLDADGEMTEFVAVEVQTIDTTGTYRNGYEELRSERTIINTSAGLNWENVNKRILPQLVYKGQVLQREAMCKKGLFFVCPRPVFEKVLTRVGGKTALAEYPAQPASLTFLIYDYAEEPQPYIDGAPISLQQTTKHSTTVYKLQEAFNNVTLPDGNVYTNAIQKALRSMHQKKLI